MLLCHSSAESWHQIFVDDDFLGQHYKYHLDSSFILSYPIHPLNIRIVGSFISSLGKMRGGMKGHFVDYLYQPQNIRRALLILVFEQQIQSDIIGQPHNYGLEDILSDLAQLHPDRRLLTGCRDWLAFFSQWNLRVRHTGRGFRDILDMEKELFLPYGIESPPYGIPETETDLLEGMIQILDRVLNKRKDEIEQDTPTIVTAASATAPIEASESPPRAETSSAQVSTGPQSVLVQYVSRWPQLRRLLQWRTKQDGSDVELQSVV
ncbi:hypothetical protein BT96DRAFT_151895 [Gymnopus androsaceus JB14]|uniref:Uncharacterized protein n=1 Tax=Gymnopus androsaceus JB14 TaxID=1447944 RepID=A0A6A4IBV1_9AGAR|nr:hypothetical protein BT96DRAFT_151895 [Gymnopus androsaceus JB14]